MDIVIPKELLNSRNNNYIDGNQFYNLTKLWKKRTSFKAGPEKWLKRNGLWGIFCEHNWYAGLRVTQQYAEYLSLSVPKDYVIYCSRYHSVVRSMLQSLSENKPLLLLSWEYPRCRMIYLPEQKRRLRR